MQPTSFHGSISLAPKSYKTVSFLIMNQSNNSEIIKTGKNAIKLSQGLRTSSSIEIFIACIIKGRSMVSKLV